MSGEFQTLGIIVQAGAVGISMILIWYINENGKRHTEERRSDRQEFNSIVKDYLDKSSQVIKDATETNKQTAILLDRISQKLDKK